MEPSVYDDELVEHGKLYKGRDYIEHRKLSLSNYDISFYFITRVYSSYVEEILKKFNKEYSPDIVILNSCLWDLTRWGPRGVIAYKKNLKILMQKFKQVLDDNCLVMWITTPPVSQEMKGGFLLEELEFLSYSLRYHIIEANQYARQIVVGYGYDVVDIHYYLRMQLTKRADDGIHWKPLAVRYITNLILTHVAVAWDVQLPHRIDSILQKQKPSTKVDEGRDERNLPSNEQVTSMHSYELTLSDLATNKGTSQLQNKQEQLCDISGGKVLSVCGSSAILEFTNANAAQRAQKHMDKELVIGKKISVNFAQKSDETDSSSYQATRSKHFLPIYHQGFSSSSSRESSSAPQKEYDKYENQRHSDINKCRKRFDFSPPLVVDKINLPGETGCYGTDNTLASFCDRNARSDNLPSWNNDFFGSTFLKNKDAGSRNSACSSCSMDNAECRPFIPNQSKKQVDLNSKHLQKNDGRVSPFVMPESALKSSTWSSAFSVDMPSVGRNNVKPISGDSSDSSADGYHAVGHCSSTFNAINRDVYLNTGLKSRRSSIDISHPVILANPIISPSFPAPMNLADTEKEQGSTEVNEMKKSIFREHAMDYFSECDDFTVRDIEDKEKYKKKGSLFKDIGLDTTDHGFEARKRKGEARRRLGQQNKTRYVSSKLPSHHHQPSLPSPSASSPRHQLKVNWTEMCRIQFGSAASKCSSCKKSW